MKKLIFVIMALITIFSASVSASAEVVIAPDVYFDSFADMPYFRTGVNSATANVVSDEDFQAYITELTRYGLPVAEARVNGTSSTGKPYDVAMVLTGNITVHYFDPAEGRYVQYGVIYAGRYVGNASGTYCANLYHEDETTYDVVGIAGASNYYQTNRPAGTVGNGYLGDLQVTYNEWMNIKNELDSISGTRFYYAMGHSINGQYRYYMTPSGMSDTYYVCNSAGQLFYYLKDEGSTEDPGGGGSTFDPTEVITAINSVYDAIVSQGSRLSARFTELITSTNSISNTLNMHMNNVVGGFDSLQGQLATLSSYFSELSGLFPVQETLTLSGSDARVAWDSADRITDVSLSGFGDGDLTVKRYPGALIDESGYEKVELSPDTTEYTLSTVEDYRRITANNEYPDTGLTITEDTLFYFPFDGSLSSSVGNITLTYLGTPQYSSGINGQAFVFDGVSNHNLSTTLTQNISLRNQSFTLSVWVNLPNYSTNTMFPLSMRVGNDWHAEFSVNRSGKVVYSCGAISGSGNRTTVNGSQVVPLNTWVNLSISCTDGSMYCFCNGVLDGSNAISSNFTSIDGKLNFNMYPQYNGRCMIDEVVFVNGSALWTSNFDPYTDAVFSEIAKDYFLPCTDQTIGLVFDDTLSKTLTPTDVSGNSITMGRLEDDFSVIYYNVETSMWMCHDPQTQTEILLSSANQQIMNDTIYIRQSYVSYAPDQVTAITLQSAFPADAPVYVDMPENAKVTITYDHYIGWFRMMYLLMDKQTQLLSDLDIVNETIVDIENTVIEISPDNDAFNIFYIEKTDGSKESVGDAAKDAAVFVGDILSMFYRLVFDDALDNAEVIQDFEDVLTTTNTGVNVW